MKVRQARIDDARAVAEVQVFTWRSAYTGIVDQEHLDTMSVDELAAQWERTLSGEELSKKHGGPIRVGVTESDEGGVDGFVAWCRCGGDDAKAGDIEVLAIYVLENAQRRGRGRALLKSVWAEAGDATSVIAWTLTDGASRAFYEAVGGAVVDHGDCCNGELAYPTVCYHMASPPEVSESAS